MTQLVTVKERPINPSVLSLEILPREEERRPSEPKKVAGWAKMLCRCGIHTGAWGYVTEGNCRQLRVCIRCGNPSVRTRHQREWRYIKGRDCAQVKECLRCAEVNGKRTRHVWGSTHSLGGDTYARDCERCGEHKEWEVSNDYD